MLVAGASLGTPCHAVIVATRRLLYFFLRLRRPRADTATTDKCSAGGCSTSPSLSPTNFDGAEFQLVSICSSVALPGVPPVCSATLRLVGRPRVGGVPLHSKKTYLLKLQIKLKTKKTKSIRALSFVGRVSTGGRQLAPVDSRERRSTPWALPGGRCARGGPRRAACTFGTI